jgi:hypothetical protein
VRHRVERVVRPAVKARKLMCTYASNPPSGSVVSPLGESARSEEIVLVCLQRFAAKPLLHFFPRFPFLPQRAHPHPLVHKLAQFRFSMRRQCYIQINDFVFSFNLRPGSCSSGLDRVLLLQQLQQAATSLRQNSTFPCRNGSTSHNSTSPCCFSAIAFPPHASLPFSLPSLQKTRAPAFRQQRSVSRVSVIR